jgi:iron-sulfur cluster repair protein YtfE (RIC family)
MEKPSKTPGQPEDAIAMLHAEHQKVRDLFRHYETTTDPATQRQIVQHVCTALARHAQLEETLFYPAFHAVTDDEGKLLVAEAVAAHQAIQELLEDLRDPDLEVEVFEARVRGLKATVEAHLAAEENALFPFAAEDLAANMAPLLDEMQALHQRLTAS